MTLFHTLARQRSLLVVGSLVIAAALAPVQGSAAAAPAAPEPTVASVTAQLDKLAEQTETLAERFNAANLHLRRVQHAAVMAQRRTVAAANRRDAAHRRFVQLLQAQYEDGPLVSTGSLLTSQSPQLYLDEVSTQTMLAQHSAGVMGEYTAAKARADSAHAAEQALLVKARGERNALAQRRSEVAAQTANLKRLLATLTAAQQRAYAARDAASRAQQRAYAARAAAARAQVRASVEHSGGGASVKVDAGGGASIKVHAGNAAAQKAVDFALAQVGKPYVFAAAGPGSFDCSGLTMAAWATAGVQLPHLASAQYGYGTHVGYNELQPGDLVFLYGDIHHVEIYIGNGLAVSAPQPGENVKIVREADHRSDFYGATRLT